MLLEIHSAIRVLLSERGAVGSSEVDICFDPPTQEWIGSLTRPTINFFLFDLQENTDLRQNSFQTTQSNNRAVKRMSPRRMDLRYMVSVLTTAIEDEHALLWRTLVTLMKYSPLPPEILPDSLRTVEVPLATRVSQPGEHSPFPDLWRGLEVQPHPALLYVVTTPIDLDIAMESPLVLTRTTRYRQRQDDHYTEERHLIGGVVRNKKGTPQAGVSVAVEGRAPDGVHTNAEGKFLLPGVSSGTVTLRVTPVTGRQQTVKINVPSPSYDITVGGDS